MRRTWLGVSTNDLDVRSPLVQYVIFQLHQEIFCHGYRPFHDAEAIVTLTSQEDLFVPLCFPWRLEKGVSSRPHHTGTLG